MTTSQQERIISFFTTQYPLSPDEHILCALSGGADSVYLLAMLDTLREKLGIGLSAAHYNHHLRGDEAARDAQFTRTLVQQRYAHVQLVVGEGDVLARAQETHRGVEETAREMRYQFLQETAKNLGCTCIATAHNANDQMETMLLNLCRGTGTRGLCGIPVVRRQVASVPIVRPILDITREEIEKTLSENQIPFVTDSTNAQNCYQRNRLRHEIIPVLNQVNQGALSHACAAAKDLCADEAYFQKVVEEKVAQSFKNQRISCAALLNQPPAIAQRMVRLLLEKTQPQQPPPQYQRTHVQAILSLARAAKPSGSVTLPHGRVIRRVYDDILFSDASPAQTKPVTLQNGAGEQSFSWGSCQITAKETVFREQSETGHVFFLPLQTDYPIIIRARQEKDTFSHVTRGTRSVKKLMIDEKIPRHMRDTLPLFCAGETVFAIAKIGKTKQGKVYAGEKALQIQINFNTEDG